MTLASKQFAIRLSLAASILMLVGKWVAYLITGSVAILSDAAESVVHIAATGFAALSLRYAERPADRSHPYGHRKIAFFSAGVEGGLILFASVGILYSALQALIVREPLSSLELGIAITGGLGLVNLALGAFLVRTGKKTQSLVLVANGHHVLTDMWTSLGVVLGVLVVRLTGLEWLDPLVGIVLALHILRVAIRLIRQAYDGLMDRVDEKVTAAIVAVLDNARAEGLISEYHQLRHRETESELWIEVHLLVDGDMTVDAAHARATQVEERLVAAAESRTVHVTSHIEPSEHHAVHPEGHEHDPLR